jgi:peptide/nickel transport system permease protein
MTRYIAQRIAALIPTLLLVSIIVFLIIRLTPGDPATIMLGEYASQEEIAKLRESLGLEQPLIVQYLIWMSRLLQLDFGYSYFLGQPVLDALLDRLGPTLSLAIMAEVFALIIAIPLGVIAAVNRGKLIDSILMGVSIFGMAVPSFLLALFLVLIFAVNLRWLPVAGYAPLSDGLAAHVRYLILPAAALGAIQVALIARMTRSSMLEVLNANYVKAARSRGVREQLIVYQHALRNAFIPVLTVIGQSFGALVAGAVVTEVIFNIPGLGQLIVNSVERRDYPIIQGGVLFITVLYVLVNLATDLLYGAVDPRLRVGRK